MYAQTCTNLLVVVLAYHMRLKLDRSRSRLGLDVYGLKTCILEVRNPGEAVLVFAVSLLYRLPLEHASSGLKCDAARSCGGGGGLLKG